MKKFSGFTFVELMIVITIIGILAAVAIPAYQDHLLKDGCKKGDVRACSELASKKAYQASSSRYDNRYTTNSNRVPEMTPTCIGGFMFAPNGQQIIGTNGGGVECR